MSASVNGRTKMSQRSAKKSSRRASGPSKLPDFESIRLLDEHGHVLPIVSGFTRLEERTIIEVRLSRAISHAYFFLTPTGTDAFELTRLIGIQTVEQEQEVRFLWEVPPATLGRLFVIACNGTVCRQSADIGVFRPQ